MHIDLESLRLRRFARSDGAAIRAALEDGQNARFLRSVPHPFPEGLEFTYISRAQEEPIRRFAIVARVDFVEQLVGACGYSPAEEGLDADWEVGLWVAPKYWGMGIAKRAVSDLMAKAHKEGIPRIAAGIHIDNPASLALFQSLGFEETGTGTCDSASRGAVPMRCFAKNLQ